MRAANTTAERHCGVSFVEAFSPLKKTSLSYRFKLWWCFIMIKANTQQETNLLLGEVPYSGLLQLYT